MTPGASPGDLTLATTTRVLARMRAGGNLLRPSEWSAYAGACASGSTAARFAVAAALHGDEARGLDHRECHACVRIGVKHWIRFHTGRDMPRHSVVIGELY